MSTTHQSTWTGRGLRILFIWPIILLWRFVTAVANAVGILLALILGTGMLMVGILLCYTFVGFFIGFPMAVVGFFLLLRALY